MDSMPFKSAIVMQCFALLGHIRKADEGGYCIHMMDRAFDYSPESGGAHFAS